MLAGLFVVLAAALVPSKAIAGKMFLEYRGQLNPDYTFFRGAFDLGDINHDGAEEMVVADDLGGFQVYKFTPGGFVPIWINDPIVQDGYIVGVEIMYATTPGMMPQILLLDSKGTLHQFRFTGYLYEQTATYENYRPPTESGRLVVTDVGGNEHTVLIAIPGHGSSAGLNAPEGSPFSAFAGMTIYKLTSGGLVPLTEQELGALQEGQVYFVQNLTDEEVKKLQSLGSQGANVFPNGHPDEGRAGVADLDRDAILELLVAMSDPKRPIDRLEILKEQGDTYSVRITLELPLMNTMVLGDVDGDGFTEIVGLTFDGEVLVYQWDSLTVEKADGTEITWETPHREVNGTIWMSLGGFEALGCTSEEGPDSLSLSRNGRTLRLDRSEGNIKCGDNVILPQVPAEMLEKTPYLPLFMALDCLGFLYSYDPKQDLVRVESGG